MDDIRRLFANQIPQRRDEIRNAKLENNLQAVIAGKAFSQLCDLQCVTVSKWLRDHTTFNDRQRINFVQQITFAKGIYENWDHIVANLQDRRMTHVDVRDFCLRKLYDAQKFSNCMDEQNRLDPSIPNPSAIPRYDEEKLGEIMQKIKDTNILGLLDYNKPQCNLLTKEITRRMKIICIEAVSNATTS